MKILHTADWHLRESQYGDFGRGLEFFESAKRLIELAKVLKDSGQIDCIVNGGDILDKKRPPSVVVKQLLDIHALLVKYEIPMFTITGNHDQDDPSWISLVDVYPDKGIIPIDNKKIDFNGISIYGALDTSKKGLEYNLAGVSGPVDVLVWHGAISEVVNFDDGSYLNIQDFLNFSRHLNTKMFLFGDIHTTKYFTPHTDLGPAVIGYPGTLEMCSTSEAPNKSVTIVDTDNLSLQFLPVSSRPFIEIDLVDESVLGVYETMLRETEQPVLIKLKYYTDERLDLFTRLSLILSERSSKFKDLIRYTGESSTKEFTEAVDTKGEITLRGIAEMQYQDRDILDLVNSLLDKKVNAPKIIEEYVHTRLISL